MLAAAARAPLDLSAARITQTDSACIMAVSEKTTVVYVMAGIFALVAIFGLVHVWRARGLTGWTVVAPVFAVIAVVFAFGAHGKVFHRDRNLAVVAAGLGPFSARERFTLAPTGKIVVSFRVERSSSAGRSTAKTTRWYDVNIEGQPALGFTVAGDRAAARDFAKKLAGVLKYDVDDRAEDDGVERVGP